MAQNDWYRAGDQIKRLVEDAVESGDFSQLGDTISDVVNDTVDGISSVLKDSIDNLQSRTEASGSRDYARTNREAAERIRRNMEQRRQSREESPDRVNRPVQVKVQVPGEIGNRAMKYFGYATGAVFGLGCLSVGLVGIATQLSALLVMAFGLGVLSGVNFVLGHRGSEGLRLGQRFRRYLDILGDRTYCLVSELAASVGESEQSVRKDLRKMIGQGFFREGYLDQKGTLLITDKETWQQYQTAQTEYEKRKAMEKQEQKTAEGSGNAKKPDGADDLEAAKAKLSPEYRELISEGEGYIRHIHECNDRIPGEEMSAKLDRLELVVTRIFREAAKNPASIPDLKKMMSYYLPTTRKLLDAYCEMDAQPVRGENIESTKKEIEKALDTLNTAFENLLDDLFEEKAWDISSDISVLNTMLAQEGLTGSDFGTAEK